MTQITVDQNNARSHPERNRNAIRASLERFGPARSIVVDKDGVIRAGNGTYEAAQELGFKTTIVDVEDGELVAIRRNDWTEDEAKAYAIADNRTTDLSEWRPETLDATFKDLPEDLIAPLDFSDDELASVGVFVAEEIDLPTLRDGDQKFHTMTFVLTNDQIDTIANALKIARRYTGDENFDNPNSNGNALFLIARAYDGSC